MGRKTKTQENRHREPSSLLVPAVTVAVVAVALAFYFVALPSRQLPSHLEQYYSCAEDVSTLRAASAKAQNPSGSSLLLYYSKEQSLETQNVWNVWAAAEGSTTQQRPITLDIPVLRKGDAVLGSAQVVVGDNLLDHVDSFFLQAQSKTLRLNLRLTQNLTHSTLTLTLILA